MKRSLDTSTTGCPSPAPDRPGATASNRLRHAEKSRESTCRFADLVAQASIDAYQRVVPASLQTSFASQQTVLAAFLVLNRSPGVTPNLEVVSLGVGTKYMKGEDIEKDVEGKCVHDCHAEVLARRGFLRFLLKEVEELQSGNPALLLKVDDTDKALEARFMMQKYKKIILYTSSAPCGNAVLKRWAKGKKEKYDSAWDDRPYEYPTPDHEKILLQSLQQGQIAPLVKREDPPDTTEATEVEPDARCDKYGRIAPGTAQLETGRGKLFSCSDKIAFWNILGVQGRELMRLIVDPLYLDVVVVGRKFSRPHLRRALCCRLQDFKPTRFEQVGVAGNAYRLNHPAILCTGVKFDKGTLTQTTNASFVETTCISWTWKDDAANLVDGLSGRSRSHGYPLVCKFALAQQLDKVSGSKCGIDRVELYRRIKLSLRRLKMFKFINDQAYAELLETKKKRRMNSDRV